MDVHVDLAWHAETDLGIGAEELARVLRVAELHDPVRITGDPFLREGRLHVVDVQHAHPRFCDLLLNACHCGSEVLACGDGVLEIHKCILREISPSSHAPSSLRRDPHWHALPLTLRLRTGSSYGTF